MQINPSLFQESGTVAGGGRFPGLFLRILCRRKATKPPRQPFGLPPLRRRGIWSATIPSRSDVCRFPVSPHSKRRFIRVPFDGLKVSGEACRSTSPAGRERRGVSRPLPDSRPTGRKGRSGLPSVSAFWRVLQNRDFRGIPSRDLRKPRKGRHSVR